MTVEVLLTADAAGDLSDIIDYISNHDSPRKSDHVRDKLEQAVLSLEAAPDRGNYPPELKALGIHEYREIFFKPYRIIYRAFPGKVYVYLITDGRRDLRTLLERRLLG